MAVLPTSPNDLSQNVLRYSALCYLQYFCSVLSYRSTLFTILMPFLGCLVVGLFCSRLALAGSQMPEEIKYLRQQQLMLLFL